MVRDIFTWGYEETCFSGFKKGGGGPWSGIYLHGDMKRHVSVVLKEGGDRFQKRWS